MTVRRWAMVVLTAAVLLAGGRWSFAMQRKSQVYRQRAGYHRGKATIKVRTASVAAWNNHLRKCQWHRALADKYDEAAAAPWRELEPDPPCPPLLPLTSERSPLTD